MATLQELVAAAPGLSARPDSVASLMDIIEDPVVDAGEIMPIVERDPGLTAGLLKLCNSPVYSFRRRIGSPREALVLVGNLTFARLCFALSLEPFLHRHLPGYALDMDTLWQHSLTTAYGTAYLVKAIGQGKQRDRAFTAGLLHDVGKLALVELELRERVNSREERLLRVALDHAVNERAAVRRDLVELLLGRQWCLRVAVVD